MSQFALEIGDAMLSKAREKYDLTDTNQAAMALRDPEVIEAAHHWSSKGRNYRGR